METKIDLRYSERTVTYPNATEAYTALTSDRKALPAIFSHRYGKITKEELSELSRFEMLEYRHNKAQGL